MTDIVLLNLRISMWGISRVLPDEVDADRALVRAGILQNAKTLDFQGFVFSFVSRVCCATVTPFPIANAVILAATPKPNKRFILAAIERSRKKRNPVSRRNRVSGLTQYRRCQPINWRTGRPVGTNSIGRPSKLRYQVCSGTPSAV